MRPNNFTPPFLKRGRGDLPFVVMLNVFKSPSIPLYKGGSGGVAPFQWRQHETI